MMAVLPDARALEILHREVGKGRLTAFGEANVLRAMLAYAKEATPPASDAAVPAGEVSADLRAHQVFDGWDKHPDAPAYWFRLPSWVQDYATACVAATEKRLAAAPKVASEADIAAENAAYLSDARWWLEIAQGKGHDSITAALEAAPHASKVASEAAMREAVKPWADYHGDLPDYDHPFRCVFESGIQYAVELLAKELGVKEWVPCDGTEEFDGDLGGTLMNIVLEAMPRDEHGDPIYPRDLSAALHPSPSGASDGGEGQAEAQAIADALCEAANESAPGRVPSYQLGVRSMALAIKPLLARLATTPGGDLLEQADAKE